VETGIFQRCGEKSVLLLKSGLPCELYALCFINSEGVKGGVMFRPPPLCFPVGSVLSWDHTSPRLPHLSSSKSIHPPSPDKMWLVVPMTLTFMCVAVISPPRQSLLLGLVTATLPPQALFASPPCRAMEVLLWGFGLRDWHLAHKAVSCRLREGKDGLQTVPAAVGLLTASLPLLSAEAVYRVLHVRFLFV